MTYVVSGTPYFELRAKEVLRKMIWQVAAFSGGGVLTGFILSNHFHVLVCVPEFSNISDAADGNGSLRGRTSISDAVQMHRALIFGKRASSLGLSPTEHRNPLPSTLFHRCSYSRESGFCAELYGCLASS